MLRKCLDNDQLEVISLRTTRLLPPGENHCSLLVKIDVTIQNGTNLQEEELNLVAKMMSKDEICFVNWPDVFKKEVFMYAELMPAYRDLEREVGIDEKDLFDILPKYVGYRNSLCIDNSLVDENSLLLMENVKTKGYDTGNRQVGKFHASLYFELIIFILVKIDVTACF